MSATAAGRPFGLRQRFFGASVGSASSAAARMRSFARCKSAICAFKRSIATSTHTLCHALLLSVVLRQRPVLTASGLPERASLLKPRAPLNLC